MQKFEESNNKILEILGDLKNEVEDLCFSKIENDKSRIKKLIDQELATNPKFFLSCFSKFVNANINHLIPGENGEDEGTIPGNRRVRLVFESF